MDTLAPNTNNLARGGAIIMLQRVGSSGYLDLGNITDFAQSQANSYLQHKTSRSGVIIVDRNEQTETGLAFKIGTDEFNAANLANILGSAAPAAFTQSSATAVTASFATPTLGAWFFVGAYRPTSVVVKVASATKVLDVDYNLEADMGVVRFLPSGSIMSSDTVDVTFNKPAIAGNVVTPFSNSGLVKGSARIYMRKSDGGLWLWDPTKVSLAYDGDLAFGGTDFAKASGTLTVEPDYQGRSAAPFGTCIQLPSA